MHQQIDRFRVVKDVHSCNLGCYLSDTSAYTEQYFTSIPGCLHGCLAGWQNILFLNSFFCGEACNRLHHQDLLASTSDAGFNVPVLYSWITANIELIECTITLLEFPGGTKTEPACSFVHPHKPASIDILVTTAIIAVMYLWHVIILSDHHQHHWCYSPYWGLDLPWYVLSAVSVQCRPHCLYTLIWAYSCILF